MDCFDAPELDPRTLAPRIAANLNKHTAPRPRVGEKRCSIVRAPTVTHIERDLRGEKPAKFKGAPGETSARAFETTQPA